MTERKFDRGHLIQAFNRIGEVSRANETILDIAIYGGSALMLASNFRFATEDVDIAELSSAWPEWLSNVVADIARQNEWSSDWLNDAVQFHLSPLADAATDHIEFGTFPHDGLPGLRIFIPTLDYMLALKLKAMRIEDAGKGDQEADDIRNLLKAGGIKDVDEAIAVLGRFFPKTAREPDKQRFYLKHIWPTEEVANDPPIYPVGRR